MTALLPPNMCQTKLFDGTLMNLRFDPSGVAGEKGLEIIESVIREYVQHDGQHIQINVVDDKTLRAAQKNPENYRNILVRVAGYMAYFTELDKSVQDGASYSEQHKADHHAPHCLGTRGDQGQAVRRSVCQHSGVLPGRKPQPNRVKI